MAKKKQTICIDFDGVLADYSKGFQGEDVFGDMIPNADIATETLKKNGWTIIIYTTRPNTEALRDWLKENKITYDYINENPDQPESSAGCKLMADIYLDDRGMTFYGDWNEWTLERIAEFTPAVKPEKQMEKAMDKAYKEGAKYKKKNMFVED